jgi:hypothetical protein
MKKMLAIGAALLSACLGYAGYRVCSEGEQEEKKQTSVYQAPAIQTNQYPVQYKTKEQTSEPEKVQQTPTEPKSANFEYRIIKEFGDIVIKDLDDFSTLCELAKSQKRTIDSMLTNHQLEDEDDKISLTLYSVKKSDFCLLEKLKLLDELEICEEGDIYASQLKNLKQLRGLMMLGSGLKEIENLNYLENLRNLYMACRLEEIPELSLKNIIRLYLPGNRIKSAKRISQFKNLEELDLSRNQISSIEPITYLKSLRYLDIIGNRVSHLLGIEKMCNLEELDISNNPITDLSPLLELPNLKEVRCFGIQDSAVIEKLKSKRVIVIHKIETQAPVSQKDEENKWPPAEELIF